MNWPELLPSIFPFCRIHLHQHGIPTITIVVAPAASFDKPGACVQGGCSRVVRVNFQQRAAPTAYDMCGLIDF
jgi:hypothetical protein